MTTAGRGERIVRPVVRAVSEETPMRSHIILHRSLALAAAVLGWAAFLSIGLWAALSFDPSRGQFAPQWIGFALIGTIAIAMAGGISASRLKLGETISMVSDASFRAGFEAARTPQRTPHTPAPEQPTPVTGGRRVR